MTFKIYFGVFAILLTSLSFKASADPKEWLMMRNQALQEQNAGGLNDHSQWGDKVTIGEAGTVETLLDPTQSVDKRTFTQRYFIDKSAAVSSNAPVLFYVCGEGECGSWVFGGAMNRYAAKFHAVKIALEHRYYGKSQPFDQLTTENMKYLTVDNALTDLVSFKHYATDKLGLSGEWILLGGSYPGALAAYGREKYPNEFVGALASSGPVVAKMDFFEYDAHVAQILPENCRQAIVKIADQLESEITDNSKFASYKSMFNADVLNDRGDFLYMLADAVAASVQYGGHAKFCDQVLASGVPGYAQGVKDMGALFGNLADMSAQAAESTDVNKFNGIIGMRQWFYQSCTEFGFFQNVNHDDAKRTRSRQINPAYHARMCDRLFGIKAPYGEEAINAEFLTPLSKPTSSHILFTNGQEDPWSRLSITDAAAQTANPNLMSIVIEGGSHCSDLGSKKTPAMEAARAQFEKLAQSWLSTP